MASRYSASVKVCTESVVEQRFSFSFMIGSSRVFGISLSVDIMILFSLSEKPPRKMFSFVKKSVLLDSDLCYTGKKESQGVAVKKSGHKKS